MGKVTAVMVLTAFTLVGSATTTYAQDGDVHCATELLDCFQEAAGVDSFWYRWAAGFDCELGFVKCAREALSGM